MTIVLDGSAGITNDGGYTGDGVVFADTTPANTLVTTTGGNVGVGTTSPSTKLDVRGPSGGVLLNIQENDSGNSRRVRISNSGTVNTIESTTGVGSTQLAFSVDGFERARIDSSGNLLVGTTSAYGTTGLTLGTTSSSGIWSATASSSGVLHMRFYNPNGVVGSISTNGTATTYATSSDYRLKENIQPMTGALSLVSALKPCTYNWKSDGSDGQGFIAHELQAVVPDAVVGEKDAVDTEGKPVYQGIDTSFLVATLTAALQEAHGLIKDLQSRVDALEAK